MNETNIYIGRLSPVYCVMGIFKTLSIAALLLVASVMGGSVFAEIDADAFGDLFGEMLEEVLEENPEILEIDDSVASGDERGEDVSAAVTPALSEGSTAASADTVIIRVNGEAIKQGDINERVERSLLERRAFGRAVSAEMRASIVKEAEREAITEVLISNAIASAAASISDEAVAREIERLSAAIPEGMTFEAALQESGMTLEALKAEIKAEIGGNQLFENLTADLDEATEADALAYYEQTPDEFVQPDHATASHIFIAFEAGVSAAGKAEKKAQLEAIRDDLVAGEITFEDAATEYSSCPSAAIGGFLGPLERGHTLPAAFEDVLFTQDLYSIGKVIETSLGYHIVQVSDRQYGGKMSFHEVKDELIVKLNQTAQQQVMDAYIERLYRSATIERVEAVN